MTMVTRPQGHKATRFIRACSFSFMLVSWFPGFLVSSVFAQPISSTELINNAAQYDGKIVVYEGEVIGDVMARGAYAWVNVNDGRNAIGIWVDRSLLGDIRVTGSYKAKGDRVEVMGTLQRICKEHGGDMDIHALALRKTYPGRSVHERVNLEKSIFAIILLGVLCLVLILKQLKTK